VRPVLVYANNVQLAVPGQIASALDEARRLAVSRGGLEPRVWALVPASVAGGVRADRTSSWTYAGDPALSRGISQIAADELPFTSDAAVTTPPLGLFERGPAGVRVFKVCAIDDGVQPVGFAADGTPVAVDAAHPPQYRVALPVRVAVPRAQFQPRHAGLEVEGCLDHCDRYYGDDPVRWLTRPGCLLPRGQS
jgi:hypothetical protein